MRLHTRPLRFRSAAALIPTAALVLLAAPAAAELPGVLPAAAALRPAGPAQDIVDEARTLARSGKRHEAIGLLQKRLAANPGDLDARTLLGTVLLWEGRYDDARAELSRVLAVEPDYIDALGALAYLELWSGHYAQAETLTARVLQRTPNDTSIMLARARALDNLNRPKEAVEVLDRLLTVDPEMTSAKQMRERILDSLRHWKVGYGYGYDWFGDSRDPWQEHDLSIGRKNRWGSATLRAAHADRFDRQDQQIELDLYPSIRSGTYLYINAGVSTKKTIYPDYRWGVDWYQSLGKGFEASIGYHYLDFGDGVDIYIGSFSKYIGNWLLISQVFYVPDALGDSQSYHAAFRRYFGDKEYFGLRYKRGMSWEEARNVEDVLLLGSEGVSGELVKLFGRRLELTLRGSWASQERVFGDTVNHYASSATLGFRF